MACTVVTFLLLKYTFVSDRRKISHLTEISPRIFRYRSLTLVGIYFERRLKRSVKSHARESSVTKEKPGVLVKRARVMFSISIL